jgi:hypothetical protein
LISTSDFHCPLGSSLMASPHTSPSPSLSRTFTLASRASQLAQIQTNIVLKELQAFFPLDTGLTPPTFQTSFMTTAGDKNQSQALYLLGGKALWTKELEVALKEGLVDMLVHSLKDVPTSLPEGCTIGAILKREDPTDCLIVKSGECWKSLEDLPDESVVGTSSVRRIAQLRRQFPKLKFLDIVSRMFSDTSSPQSTSFTPASVEICKHHSSTNNLIDLTSVIGILASLNSMLQMGLMPR